MTRQIPLIPARASPDPRPVLHLRSWGWVRARRRANEWPPPDHSGRAYTIMANPRADFGERGDGHVPALVPQGQERDLLHELVRLRRTGAGVADDSALLVQYRTALEARWANLDLSASGLLVYHAAGLGRVQPGDTLCCACSEVNALRGECHRAWAAPLLARAGWRVFLEGVEVVTGG